MENSGSTSTRTVEGLTEQLLNNSEKINSSNSKTVTGKVPPLSQPQQSQSQTQAQHAAGTRASFTCILDPAIISSLTKNAARHYAGTDSIDPEMTGGLYTLPTELEFITVDETTGVATLVSGGTSSGTVGSPGLGSGIPASATNFQLNATGSGAGIPAVIYMQPYFPNPGDPESASAAGAPGGLCHLLSDSAYENLLPLSLYSHSVPPEMPLAAGSQGTGIIDDESQTPKEKRVARAVMVVAFLLLAMCVVLVGVTLSMSDHIDNMVRKLHMHRMDGMLSRLPTNRDQSLLSSSTPSGSTSTSGGSTGSLSNSNILDFVLNQTRTYR